MADIFEANGLVGDAVNPYQQTYADTCAIKSQQIILNEFGIPATEDQLVQYSYERVGIMVMAQELQCKMWAICLKMQIFLVRVKPMQMCLI